MTFETDPTYCCNLLKRKPALHDFLLGVEDSDLAWWQRLMLQTYCCELDHDHEPDEHGRDTCEIEEGDLTLFATEHNWRNPALVSDVLGSFQGMLDMMERQHMELSQIRSAFRNAS